MKSTGVLGRIFWWFWLPEYEGDGPWHLRLRATVAYWIRRAWYHGKTAPCCCGPGCDEQVPMASASGMCRDCLNEDCQHDDGDPFDDPSYQRFLEETAKACRARDKPCPGCYAGGMCDGWLGGYFAETNEGRDADDYLDYGSEDDQ